MTGSLIKALLLPQKMGGKGLIFSLILAVIPEKPRKRFFCSLHMKVPLTTACGLGKNFRISKIFRGNNWLLHR